MRSLLIACSLLFSAHAFSATTVSASKSITITEDKGVERHSYYFGMVRVNSVNTVTYTVTNTGTTPLTFHSASVSGIGFSGVHSCSGVLAPKDWCQFRIQYAPYMEGYHVGQFYLAFDPESDILVNISGQTTR
ncbi:MAG: choice-of-anchor D domain-containing protein [Bdellovibrionales bacterium]|nr:choice-of-anchor D domain-containing protein [Bdellovibrionales bacterium]